MTETERLKAAAGKQMGELVAQWRAGRRKEWRAAVDATLDYYDHCLAEESRRERVRQRQTVAPEIRHLSRHLRVVALRRAE